MLVPIFDCIFHLGSENSPWCDLRNSITDYSFKVFQLMCDAPFEWGCCLEDYSGKSTLPKIANLLRGPRQRMYGILFFEKPGALNKDLTDFVFKVEELTMIGPGSLDRSNMVKPTMPPVEDHPGLKALWKNQREREFQFNLQKSMDELGKYLTKYSSILHLDTFLKQSHKFQILLGG